MSEVGVLPFYGQMNKFYGRLKRIKKIPGEMQALTGQLVNSVY